MQRWETAAAILVLTTALATAAGWQAKPDFSGVWKPMDAADAAPPPPLPPPATPRGSGPPPPPPPPRTLSLTIEQSATDLRIVRRADADGREIVHTFTYKLDGTESVNQMGAVLLRTQAAWKGEALVLSSTATVEERPFGGIRDVYRIEEGKLVVESTREAPAGISVTKAVFRKQ